MYTETIKSATLENHQQVEKVLVGKMKSMRSMNDYIDMLQIFYGYFGGLEQQIKTFINADNLHDFDQRRKTAALTGDLAALGGTVPSIATDADLPAITNQLQAFGALYVIEGSTLGGKIIAGMLQKHLHLPGETGLSFFKGYGDDTDKMWTGFKTSLNAIAQTADDQQAITNAANETFVKFKSWIEK